MDACPPSHGRHHAKLIIWYDNESGFTNQLARLLRKAGFDVETEYYINDAGRQMRILGLSVWLRVKELAGRPVEWPEDYYRGSYIIDIAREMLAEDPSLPDMEDQAVRTAATNAP